MSTDTALDALKYPIGKFERKDKRNVDELLQSVMDIQFLPAELGKMLNGIDPEKMKNSYRPGGWNALQVIHHLADSHMNAFVRTKLILTEENPRIKPYKEELWATGPDYTYSHEASYLLLVGLHQRWSLLLLDCLKTPALLDRCMDHPEHDKPMPLSELIALYAWHGKHHAAHIRQALAK